MPKIRVIKDYKEYRKGDVIDVTPNIAFGLIEKGVAQVDKMMTRENYRVGKRRDRG